MQPLTDPKDVPFLIIFRHLLAMFRYFLTKSTKEQTLSIATHFAGAHPSCASVKVYSTIFL